MNETKQEEWPLSGVCILELGSAILGPYACQQLAEYGADVIKIEPFEGDITRNMGPASESGMAALFLACNRGKKSVALNMKVHGARAVLDRLLARCDVLVHNIRPKKASQLGLAASELISRYPALIVASLSGFLSEGPYADDAAYDDIIQALSGLAGLSAAIDGKPAYLPTAIADKTTANVAVQAILAALFRKERTGRGSMVEVPMLETMVAYTVVEHLGGWQFEPPQGTVGYSRYLSPLHRPIATADGYVSARPMTDRHWSGCFAALGDEEAASDPRFTSISQRSVHIDAAFERLERSTRALSTDRCLEILRNLDVPCSRIQLLEDLFTDPHLKQVKMFESVEDPGMGTLRFSASGPRFEGGYRSLSIPPRLGEHTEQLLAEAGFSSDEIDDLRNAGVVAGREVTKASNSRSES